MPRTYKGRTLTPKACPHCAGMYPSIKLHIAGCVMEPEARERTRLALDDGTGMIRPIDDYKRDRRGGLAYKTLRQKYSQWRIVAEVFGLEPQKSARNGAGCNALDRLLSKLGPEMDREMAENRRLTSAGYRG